MRLEQRSPVKKRPDAQIGQAPERSSLFQAMADRAKGLTQLLTLIATIGGSVMEMVPAPALAQEPTEQADPKLSEALRAFDQLQQAYQQFDSNNLQATAQILDLYQRSMDLMVHLPPEQRSEYQRQFAYINHRSLVLQYDSRSPEIPVQKVATRDSKKTEDKAILVLSLSLLNQAETTRSQARPDGFEAAQANATFKLKVEQLRHDIQTTLECIMGNLPEAISGKQALIDRIQLVLKQKGYDASVTNLNGIAEGRVFVQIQVKMPDGNTVAFQPEVVYNPTKAKAEYVRDGGTFGRAIQINADIVAGLG